MFQVEKRVRQNKKGNEFKSENKKASLNNKKNDY